MESQHEYSGKSILNPKSFQGDNIERREKNIFKTNFVQNGSLEFKYKKKFARTSFHLKNILQYTPNPVTNKIELGLEIPKITIPDGEVSVNLNLEKKPQIDFHIFRKNFPKVTIGASLNESYRLKDTKISVNYHPSFAKLKFKLTRSLGKKHDASPWTSQITCLNSFHHPILSENGVQLTNEENLTNFKQFEGTTLLKVGKKKQANVGLLASHKFSTRHLIPTFHDFTFFYSTSDSLMSLKLKDLRKATKIFTVGFVNKFTDNIDVGILLNRDADKNMTNLQVGMKIATRRDELRLKIKDNLEGAVSYSYDVDRIVRFSISHKFALASNSLDASQEGFGLPFGMRFEMKG